MKYSLNRQVAEIYNAIGPYDYEHLISEGLVDKNSLRVMKTANIMVDGSKYTGQFLKSTLIKDGIGHIIYTDGSLFEGAFKMNDTIKGRYITTRGYIYEGEMRNHKMHGYGELMFDREVIYSGEFEDGEQVEESIDLKTAPNSKKSQSNNQNCGKSVQFLL
eukprot:CAMPEP_0168326792 /NCGR_PEP_ID=MMETSP0213-20121227/5520_1 /TAXON_ID=151035 /ORGANISM="Euplotes harpa, Strain FSP1.4" /LENGTH=160 /DNA_ID=CAMNT_0008329587 /DNA_START=239 /DNA_END=721 /DNA_ORIENTATION=+